VACGNPRLRPPRSLVDLLERRFLVSMLLDGLERQAVVVRAAAGFGKTELLAAGFRQLSGASADAHIGWLTLAPIHADPARFRSELAEALGAAPFAGIDDLIEELAARPGRTVLFIDDLENAPSPEVLDCLGKLLLGAPESLRIAIATSGKAVLPLARLRLRGLLTEIGPRHLSFTHAEMRRLLGRSVSTADIAAIERVTGGWPALLRLAGGFGQLDQASRETMLAGRSPEFLDYVNEVVLSDMSAPTAAALRCCAILEEFPAELLSELAPETAGMVDVRSLDQLSPAVEAGISKPGWYRLHPVVRASFLASMAIENDQLASDLHRRTAVWFAGRGFLEKAVGHAVAGRDFQFATETIKRAGGVDIFIRAGHTVLEALIDGLPRDVVYASPGLSLCYSLILAKRGRVAEARHLLDQLMHDDTPHGEFDRRVGGALDHIDSMIDIYQDKRLDPALIARLEGAVAAFGPQRTEERGWIYNHLCLVYTRLGDLEPARLSALAALACYREERAVYAQIFMLMHLGLVSTLSGNFAASLSFSREAQDLIQSAQWSDANLAAIVRLVSCEVHYLQGDVALASAGLSECLAPMTYGEAWVELYSRLFQTLARCRLREDGLDAAVAIVDKAEEVASNRGLPRLRIAARILRMDLFVSAGLLESARHIAEELAGSLTAGRDTDTVTWREENDLSLALARLRIASGAAYEALVEIGRVQARSKKNGSGFHLLFATILSCHANWLCGREERALQALQSAIALARAHEAVQPFIDEGAAFASTVRAIIRRFGLGSFSSDAVDFISRIVGEAVRKRRTAPQGTVEETDRDALFTLREHEVLIHLSDGKSNKEIARALNMSEATVKFHLKNVFAKLGVSRRAMALAVARRLNIH